MSSERKSEYNVNKLILNRTSPRAMSGEKIDEKDFLSILEAGRYAPSAFNTQPWKFLYAKRDTKEWDLFFDALVDFNKLWVKNAGAVILVIAEKLSNGEEQILNVFSSGAAMQNMALQSSYLGLVAHAMSGFDYSKLRTNLKIPEKYHVLAIIAIGKKGDIKDLQIELQDKEIVSSRKDLSEIAIEGKFK